MKAIIAEDDLISRLMLSKLLIRWGYETTAVDNGEAAWEALQDLDVPAIVLLDWMMPGMDGIEVCRKLRDLESKSSSYVILLTSKDGKSDIIQGLEAGADDYLPKPYDPEELQARLKVGKRIIDLQDRLIRLSNTDVLTSMNNRRRFFDAMKAEMYRSQRYKIPLCLISLDMDNFKLINDTFGHDAGDEVLRAFSQLITERLRESDIACRIGGDEFVIILPHTELVNACVVAEKLRETVEQLNFQPNQADAGAPAWRITLSIGVAELGETDLTVDDFYKRTDSYLYRAKNAGRNCVYTLNLGAGAD
jgi:two-component system cell cycle response regulator